MPSNRPKDLINTRRAARILRLHVNSVRRWIAEGKLTGYRHGGRWHVSKAEVKRHLSVKPATIFLPESRSKIARHADRVCQELSDLGY